MYPGRFEYADPATVEQAVAYLQEHADDDVKVLAGGQSLIPLMRLRFARPDFLVDIGRIEALRFLLLDLGGLRIGALTREAELEADPAVRRAFPILHDATRVIADPVVRNLATVGGNLAHGDPANDHPAVMVALEASIVASGPGGEREIPAGEFFKDLFETALEPAELLTEIRVPAQPPGSGAAYVKFERQAGDFAIAAAAARVTVAGGAVTGARLVYTNVGSTPVRAEQAERILTGHALTPREARAAGLAAAAALDLADDQRGSAAYKRRVVIAVTERALRLAARRATEGSGEPERETPARPPGRRAAPDISPQAGPAGGRVSEPEACPVRTIQVEVNGRRVAAEVEPRLLLVHFLRWRAGLTGTRVGCDTTSCGACTVLLDGRAVKACTMFAVQADRRQVTTVEGLAPDGAPLHPLQEAFWAEHGLQCGYCTSGLLMAARNLVADAQGELRDEDIREAISGNLCRCTGYVNVVAAIRRATRLAGSSGQPPGPRGP